MPILCPMIEGTGFSAIAVGDLMHAGGIRMELRVSQFIDSTLSGGPFPIALG